MPKIIITKGLSGSGKTYWTKEFIEKNPSFINVNRDDLRYMRFPYWKPKQEGLITEMQFACFDIAIKNKLNVISSDTNLNPKTFNNIKEHFVKASYEVEVKDFTNIPIETCITRDLKRFNSVGEKVIRAMYNRYLVPKTEYKQNPQLHHAIISDLDGTLCLYGDKNPYDRDFINDELNQAVYEIITNYRGHLVLFSGRNDKYYQETIKWLNKNSIFNYELVMRKDGDNRKDSVIKNEFFDKYIRNKYYVDFVLDDRNQVVELWRSLGLTCFQVAEGNF